MRTLGPIFAATPASSHNGMLLLVGLAILFVIGGGLVVVRRYAHPDALASDREPLLPRTAAGLKFEQLLDASRRLKRIGSTDELHRALLREATGLVDARSGALILREGDGFVVGQEGEPDLLVRDRLAEGAIGRIAETGRPIVEVSANEPAIRHAPVALVGVPLVEGGSVYGVLVLVRPSAAPFSSLERDMLSALAPVAASAGS